MLLLPRALFRTTVLVEHCQRTLAGGAALLHDGYKRSEWQLHKAGPLKARAIATLATSCAALLRGFEGRILTRPDASEALNLSCGTRAMQRFGRSGQSFTT